MCVYSHAYTTLDVIFKDAVTSFDIVSHWPVVQQAAVSLFTSPPALRLLEEVLGLEFRSSSLRAKKFTNLSYLPNLRWTHKNAQHYRYNASVCVCLCVIHTHTGIMLYSRYLDLTHFN